MKEAIQKRVSLLHFYLEYGFKFTQWFIRNIRNLWLDFLKMERDYLRVEAYALQNKRLNKKHGEFNSEGRVLNGFSGISKALEIDTSTASRILKLGKDENELFKREVKARTEPYTHLTKKPDIEKKIAEKEEKLKGQGLGTIIAVKEQEEEFEMSPTDDQLEAIKGDDDERREED